MSTQQWKIRHTILKVSLKQVQSNQINVNINTSKSNPFRDWSLFMAGVGVEEKMF
jgi:hypothetical protein